MGMSTYVVALKQADDKWRQMKAVYDACQAADVPAPPEVDDYFGGMAPDPSGVIIDHPHLVDVGAVTEWTDGNMREGYEVALGKLPAYVTSIRFINSY